MDVNGSAPVPVRVAMTREDCNAAACRRVERIIVGVQFILVVGMVSMVIAAVAMVMFGEGGVIGMSVAAVANHHRRFEPVRLGNLLDGLPIRAAFGERENLPRAGFAKCLHVHPISLRPREPEARRNAVLENGKLNDAVARVDGLQFGSMKSRALAAEKGKIVTMAVAMPSTVPVAASALQLAP